MIGNFIKQQIVQGLLGSLLHRFNVGEMETFDDAWTVTVKGYKFSVGFIITRKA